MTLLPAMVAWAEVGDEFTADGLKYKVTSEAPKSVEVTGYDGNQPKGDLMIPDIVNDYSVTTIGYYAFQNCTGLTSITIPNSVTTIGDNAFANCTGLTSIDFPNGLTSIGRYAFLACI